MFFVSAKKIELDIYNKVEYNMTLKILGKKRRFFSFETNELTCEHKKEFRENFFLISLLSIPIYRHTSVYNCS